MSAIDDDTYATSGVWWSVVPVGWFRPQRERESEEEGLHYWKGSHEPLRVRSLTLKNEWSHIDSASTRATIVLRLLVHQ